MTEADDGIDDKPAGQLINTQKTGLKTLHKIVPDSVSLLIINVY
jgi:hypothetical protein